MTKTVALVIGVVFLLLGVIGLMDTSIVGHSDTAVFKVDQPHNWVHLISGLAGVGAALAGMAVMYLRIFGGLYGLLAILGFIQAPDGGELLGMVTINTADNWLHIVFAIALLGIGFMKPKTSTAAV